MGKLASRLRRLVHPDGHGPAYWRNTNWVAENDGAEEALALWSVDDPATPATTFRDQRASIQSLPPEGIPTREPPAPSRNTPPARHRRPPQHDEDDDNSEVDHHHHVDPDVIDLHPAHSPPSTPDSPHPVPRSSRTNMPGLTKLALRKVKAGASAKQRKASTGPNPHSDGLAARMKPMVDVDALPSREVRFVEEDFVDAESSSDLDDADARPVMDLSSTTQRTVSDVGNRRQRVVLLSSDKPDQRLTFEEDATHDRAITAAIPVSLTVTSLPHTQPSRRISSLGQEAASLAAGSSPDLFQPRGPPPRSASSHVPASSHVLLSSPEQHTAHAKSKTLVVPVDYDVPEEDLTELETRAPVERTERANTWSAVTWKTRASMATSGPEGRHSTHGQRAPKSPRQKPRRALSFAFWNTAGDADPKAKNTSGGKGRRRSLLGERLSSLLMRSREETPDAPPPPKGERSLKRSLSRRKSTVAGTRKTGTPPVHRNLREALDKQKKTTPTGAQGSGKAHLASVRMPAHYVDKGAAPNSLRVSGNFSTAAEPSETSFSAVPTPFSSRNQMRELSSVSSSTNSGRQITSSPPSEGPVVSTKSVASLDDPSALDSAETNENTRVNTPRQKAPEAASGSIVSNSSSFTPPGSSLQEGRQRRIPRNLTTIPSPRSGTFNEIKAVFERRG